MEAQRCASPYFYFQSGYHSHIYSRPTQSQYLKVDRRKVENGSYKSELKLNNVLPQLLCLLLLSIGIL